jgi:MFS family permease
MTEPNPYSPPVEPKPPPFGEKLLPEDERRARAYASWALGLAILSIGCAPVLGGISIFLAWRALKLRPSPSEPAKFAIVAICLSVIFTAFFLYLAIWQFLDSAPRPQRPVPTSAPQ